MDEHGGAPFRLGEKKPSSAARAETKAEKKRQAAAAAAVARDPEKTAPAPMQQEQPASSGVFAANEGDAEAGKVAGGERKVEEC